MMPASFTPVENRNGVTTNHVSSLKPQSFPTLTEALSILVEFLPDGRTANICIPEGNRPAGWSLFEYHLIRFFGHLVSQTLPKTLRKPFPMLIHFKLVPSLPNPQNPPCHLTPKQWSNPQESLLSQPPHQGVYTNR